MPKTEAHRLEKESSRVKRKSKKVVDVDDEEDDTDFDALPKWKLCLIGAIAILCFALLYPSVFGPILNSLVGRTQPATTQAPSMPPVHPALNRQSGGARPHMHPAASARMPHVESQQQGGRGGMFTWMLPIYTIGVMGFLCYTLFKIMFKSKKRKSKRRQHTYSSEEEEEASDDGEENELASGMNHKRLRTLQSRLHETEAAMSKILEQLETIAQTSTNDPTAPETTSEEIKADAADKMTPEQLRNIEDSMQRLTELSKLYKKQKAELEASDEGEESSEEEDGIVGNELDDFNTGVFERNETVRPDTGDEVVSESESEDGKPEVEIDDPPPEVPKQVRRRPKRE